MTLNLALVTIVIIYGLILFEKWINRKLPKYEDVAETKGANILYFGSLFIFVVMLALAKFGDITNLTFVKWGTIAGVTLMWAFRAFMEWKYLESKKYKNTILVMALGILLIFGMFFVYEARTQTTYGEVVSSIIGDNEVEEVFIFSRDVDDAGYRHKEVSITDKEIMKKFIESPIANMELKKRNVLPGMEYRIMIRTDGGPALYVEFSPGEQLIRIQYEQYVIDGENEILELINNLELEWQEGL